MKNWNKKSTRLKKILWILLLTEIILSVFLIIRYNGKQQVWNFDQSNLTANAGEFKEDGTYYIDASSGMAGDVCLTSGPLTLTKGVYRVQIHFDAEEEQALRVVDPTLGYHALLVNAVSMHDDERTNETGVTAILLKNTNDLEIQVYYTGEGALEVDSITLTHTNQEYGILLCFLILISALVDGAIWLATKKKENGISLQTCQVIYFLTIMSILVCLPLFIDYIQLADDVYFHITRIEGLVQAWKSGQFPARMQPNWLDGMGYPVSIMYGDVFLWFSAILHMLGFDIMQSYKAGVAFMNVFTVIVSYFSFKDIFKSRKIGLWGTFMYTFSLYRLYNVYMRGAVGEYTAMAFLPVVVWGLHGLLSADEKEAGKKKYRWILAAGFSGLLVSHVLSFEFACIFTILTLLIMWKRTFRKVTILGIIQAAILAIAANLWFLVPFLDYALHMKMLVFSNVVQIQERGLYLTQLLSIFQWAGANAYMIYNGMQDVRPFGMGISLMIICGTFLYIWFVKRNKVLLKEETALGKISLCFGILASVFCLSIFPWDAIGASSEALTKITSSIQFPYRFLVIVMISFCMAGCVLLKNFMAQKNKRAAKLFAFILVLTTTLQAAFLLDDIMQYKGYSQLRNAEALGSEMVSGSEYLLDGTESRMLYYNTVVCGDNVTYENYEKNYLTVHMTCENTGEEDSYIEPTLLYYMGYQAIDDATGESLEMEAGTNNVMRVILPAGYEGSITIQFTGMWYWKITDIFSLIIWVGIVFYWVTYYIRRKKTDKK